jgi:hypothetical protein
MVHRLSFRDRLTPAAVAEISLIRTFTASAIRVWGRTLTRVVLERVLPPSTPARPTTCSRAPLHDLNWACFSPLNHSTSRWSFGCSSLVSATAWTKRFTPAAEKRSVTFSSRAPAVGRIAQPESRNTINAWDALAASHPSWCTLLQSIVLDHRKCRPLLRPERKLPPLKCQALNLLTPRLLTKTCENLREGGHKRH